MPRHDARLAPGDPAPAFTLTADDGSTVALSDFAGQRVVVYFYPAAMTPGCTKQACDFRDSLDVARRRRVSRWSGISPDKPEKLAKFRERDGLTFPLLSDPDKKVLEAYGAFGEKKLYGKTVVGVIRSTFVIDAKGKIEHRAVQREGHRPRRQAEARPRPRVTTRQVVAIIIILGCKNWLKYLGVRRPDHGRSVHVPTASSSAGSSADEVENLRAGIERKPRRPESPLRPPRRQPKRAVRRETYYNQTHQTPPRSRSIRAARRRRH